MNNSIIIEPTSQDHGRVFERHMRDCGRFPKAINSKASNSDAIDIQARYDEALHLHTSVKVTGSDSIGLADAIRFYEIDRPFRFIIGTWKQISDETKAIQAIHELIVTTKTLARLHGRLTVAEIRDMHQTYASFPAGPEGKVLAKQAAGRMIRAARPRAGLVRLDFKGDDKNGRRLQLSIKLSALINAVKDDPTYIYDRIVTPTYLCERSIYHGLQLPLEIESTPRRFFSLDSSPQISMPFLKEPIQRSEIPQEVVKLRLVTRQDDEARQRALLTSNPIQKSFLG